MTIEKIEELLESGEGFTIEYKECVNGLNNSVFETVCSFSNRYSVRSVIAREIISNLLVHREFASAFPAKLIIEKDKIYTENWNRAQRFGKIEPQDFTPYPKNPTLANFFVNIGYADSLGSGVRNLYKYTKIYSGGEPDFEEGDVFKLTVPLVNTEKIIVKSKDLTERQAKIINMIKQDKSIIMDFIAAELAVSKKTISREVQEIKKICFITYDKKQKQWVFR